MENNTGDKIEEFLEKQLERTNTWLSFAEAKNAAIVAINVAVIAFAYGLRAEHPWLSCLISALLTISTFISLLSFYPKDKGVIELTTSERPGSNLTFWKDVACVESGEKYLLLVKSEYFSGTTGNAESAMHNDLANEIVANSRITVLKYNKFKMSLRIDLAAIAICIIPFAIEFFELCKLTLIG